MLTIYAEDVNDAYDKAVIQMERVGCPEGSRNGEVRVAPCPVMTVYDKPQQRVLFNRHRDANPFFHLFECLWMLSGRDDGRWLDRFVSNFSERYSEPDTGRVWGAYGARWRNWFGYDQLDEVVRRLRENPLDRRVVVQMFDGRVDMCSERHTNTGEPARDIPCNTQIYPRVVSGALDITVTCRSNDVVWGAYGANAVHFSFLQEYLAGRIGIRVGRYYHLSNNWHLYSAVADKFRRDPLPIYPRHTPIGDCWDAWDADLKKFMQNPGAIVYENAWFLFVARPMWRTHDLWKKGLRAEALRSVDEVQAEDWRSAARDWMRRRHG